MFTTENLIIRGLKFSDSEALSDIENDADIQQLAQPSYLTPYSDARWASVLKNAAENPNNILKVVLETRDTREVIGHLGLRLDVPKNRDATLGVVIGKNWWGKGYGTEACKWAVAHGFEELGLHRVSLVVWGDNARARRVYEKIGFQVEGTKRKAVWYNARWHDEIQMGIIDEDYFRTVQE